ncbi:MAG: cellulase family glycosylhydrolase [Bacteroidales bacterium]
MKKQLLNTPATTQNTFIRINDNGQFIRKEKPYYFIGTNFWYGAILGSEGLGGDRRRLCRELDLMKETGITNLRVLVGANGTDGVKTRVEPALQTAPGVYNDTLLDGLDFFMNELHKRDMTAVLYLNNSWEWSGGYSVYLEWAGYGKAVVPAIDGWPAYMKYVSQFQQSEAAKTLFANYVRDIIGRTNRYNQLKYTDDPTILSWQIGNEPRAFSNENKESFATWMAETASLIKSLDSNHLVSSGSEGEWGCENDMALFEQIHANKHIDYLNIHIWPYNWGWVKADSLAEYLPAAIENTHHYIDKHLIVARKYKKPIVIEEFGFPRDGFRFEKQAPVVVRDRYYKAVFDRIVTDKKQSGLIAGCNFWAWGGFAKQNPNCVFWSRGDDYMGDPAQEEQGLNSVFAEDTTIRLIKESNYKLSSCESVDN